ncbi:MAG: hypothetical protein ACK52X_07510 [bacterium]
MFLVTTNLIPTVRLSLNYFNTYCAPALGSGGGDVGGVVVVVVVIVGQVETLHGLQKSYLTEMTVQHLRIELTLC